MTESQWLSSTDPKVMLNKLMSWQQDDLERPETIIHVRPPSDRKLRLFACACCRQVWTMLNDDAPCLNCNGEGCLRVSGPVSLADLDIRERCNVCRGTGGINRNRSRHAVEVAERFADGLAAEEEMLAANAGALEVWTTKPTEWNGPPTMLLTYPKHPFHFGGDILPAAQAALLRCIVGNPWRPKSGLIRDRVGLQGQRDISYPSWLSWNDGCIPKMAAAMYEANDFRDMPKLGDALEEAGCVDAEILNHCRSAGPHARGCWCLDLLLGKD